MYLFASHPLRQAHQHLMTWVNHLIEATGLDPARLFSAGQHHQQDFLMVLMGAHVSRQVQLVQQAQSQNRPAEKMRTLGKLQSSLKLFVEYARFSTAAEADLRNPPAAQQAQSLRLQAATAAANGLDQLEARLQQAATAAERAFPEPNNLSSDRPIQSFYGLAEIKRNLPGTEAQKLILGKMIDNALKTGWIFIYKQNSHKEKRVSLVFDNSQLPQAMIEEKIILLGNTRAVPFETMQEIFTGILATETASPLQFLNWRFPGLPWSDLESSVRGSIYLWAAPGVFSVDLKNLKKSFIDDSVKGKIGDPNPIFFQIEAEIFKSLKALKLSTLSELFHKMKNAEFDGFLGRYPHLDIYILEKANIKQIIDWEIHGFDNLENKPMKLILGAAKKLGFNTTDELKLAMQAQPVDSIDAALW
jgi:hypothetical protein